LAPNRTQGYLLTALGASEVAGQRAARNSVNRGAQSLLLDSAVLTNVYNARIINVHNTTSHQVNKDYCPQCVWRRNIIEEKTGASS
jgi:hypothetical protein